MWKCKKCGNENYSSDYKCRCGMYKSDNEKQSGDFLTSALIGLGTDSAIAGALIGGDVVGAAIGDLLDGDLFD